MEVRPRSDYSRECKGTRSQGVGDFKFPDGSRVRGQRK